MDEFLQAIEANWMILAGVLIAVLLVGVLLQRRASRGAAPRDYKPDVLDEGAASIKRNQALIDAPPAAAVITPPALGATMGGLAEAVTIGAQDMVEEAAAAREVAAPPPPPPLPPPLEVPAPEPDVVPEPAPEVAPEPAPETVPAPDYQPEPQPQPEFEPEPAPVPAPEPTSEPAQEPGLPISGGGSDDLSRIKGLGPKLQALLPTLGITSFAQIAAFTEADLEQLDSQLGPFAGRPAKDSWVEQAQFLAGGNVSGFEEKFGRV